MGCALFVLDWVRRDCGKMLAFRVRLTNHICGFLVVPEANKTAVTKVIVRSPFEKLELADQQRREPNTFGHLLCSEALPPPPAPGFPADSEMGTWTSRGP